MHKSAKISSFYLLWLRLIVVMTIVITPVYAVDINIIDSLTIQRTDGSNLFDIYYEVKNIEMPINIAVYPITEDNDTLHMNSLVAPSDIGLISTDGIKHIIWEPQKDLKNTNYHGFLEFSFQILPIETSKECIYISNCKSDTIVMIDDIYGLNYKILDANLFGGLNTGNDIANDTKGRMYIVDTYNKRLVRIDNMKGIGSVSLQSNLDKDDFFGILGSVTIDNNEKIYVTDMDNHRIIRIDDMSGSGWITFGKPGFEEGEFTQPMGIAVDSQNRIYVADTYNHRIARIDNMNGDGWITLGTLGAGQFNFNRPSGIDIDDRDRIYVSDRMNNRIVRLENMDGSGWQVCYPGIKASQQIAVDSEYNIYITDFQNNRIVRVTDMEPSTVVFFSTGLNKPYGIHIHK